MNAATVGGEASKEEGTREAAAGADLMSEEKAICCSAYSPARKHGNPREGREEEEKQQQQRVLKEEKSNRNWRQIGFRR